MVLTGGGNVLISVLCVAVLCSFAYAFHGFEKFKQRLALFLACCVVLVVTAYVNNNPLKLQIAEIETDLETDGKYRVLLHGSDTLIIGSAFGGEEAVLHYLNKRGKSRAALLLTHPPHPDDAERLALLIPRVHTLYLPAHATGVTGSLMKLALEEVYLDDLNIVFLEDGDRRVFRGTTLEVRAFGLGWFEVDIVPK
jgi:hypothetical protein